MNRLRCSCFFIGPVLAGGPAARPRRKGGRDIGNLCPGGKVGQEQQLAEEPGEDYDNCRMAAKAAHCSHEIAGRSEEMSNQRRESAAPVEPYFDCTPQPFGDGPPDPLVYDASPRMLRQRTVNFAAKRLADMRYVSRLARP